jgi:nucleoid DNA-binding protein
MDELIRLVAQRAGISAAQASLAVSAMLSYLTARLPSPVVGHIREQLNKARNPSNHGGEGGAN